MMNFSSINIDAYVNIFEEAYKKNIKNLREREPNTLYMPIIDLLERRGKRLRPVLCIMSCELFGGDIKKAIPTAVSIELFHNFSLVHDDIEDGSELRRGEKALYVKYGVPIAINAGDCLYALCYEALKENKKEIGIERAWEIFKKIVDVSIHLTEGQAKDFKFKEERSINEEDVIELLRKKTGKLFALSAECGAISSGAFYEIARDLGNAWENIGIAFQIRDDILNVIGEEKKYGKKIGEDIAEGKPSLLLIHCLEHCNEREKEKIYGTFYKYDRLKIKEIINLFNKYGSIEYSERAAKKYLSIGVDKIREIEGKEEIKNKMIKLAEYFVMREE